MTKLLRGKSGFFNYQLSPDGQKRELRPPKEKSAGVKASGVFYFGAGLSRQAAHTFRRPLLLLSRPQLLVNISFIIVTLLAVPAKAEQTEASWYSQESCKREGTSGICANGEVFNDEKLICASWDYPFGTRLKVKNQQTGAEVIVLVIDRGPAKKLYKKGRKIDLSKSAFNKIASLKQGLVRVTIEVIPNGR